MYRSLNSCTAELKQGLMNSGSSTFAWSSNVGMVHPSISSLLSSTTDRAAHNLISFASQLPGREGRRKGGKEEGREGGREGRRKGGKEDGGKEGLGRGGGEGRREGGEGMGSSNQQL